MKKWKSPLCSFFLTVLFLFILVGIKIPIVKALQGRAKAYITSLAGAEERWVGNSLTVAHGAVEAFTPLEDLRAICTPQVWEDLQQHHLPSWPDWIVYKTIIESYREVIVINTQGEITPIPSGYDKEGWTDRIAQKRHSGG